MSWLTMSPGHKIKVGVTFEAPDDEFVAMTADPEVQAQAVEGTMSHEDVDVDEAMGLKSVAMAQLTIMTGAVTVGEGENESTYMPTGQEKTVFMTEDELRRHIYECRAILKSMGAFAGLVDDEMARYRDGVRKKAVT